MRAVGGAPTPLLRIYQAGTTLLGPIVYGRVGRKLRRQGVDERRVGEKMGYATLPRPPGRLIWFHAASVGESLSVLTLIRRLGDRLADAEFLITSGTATSARLVEARIPPRTRHQFAPLDIPGSVERFYDHWRPAAGIFVESELWPNLLMQGRKSGVPLALVNARLSEKSVQGWKRWPDTTRQVLNGFSVMLTQNRRVADNLVAMGADPARVRVSVNLKSTSDPLPVDRVVLDQIRKNLGGRPVWIASSTHPGEEEQVLDAHRTLLDAQPELCLVLVPRHPDRGSEVADLMQRAGLTFARRSMDQSITRNTPV
ncbi:MAG: glycosyltransferase N-terminal domain-containing protein, partial [Pseudomonadota bacterium]